MIDLDDVRQDIFDIKTVPKVLYVYRGDTFEVDLVLNIASSELSYVVLNCDGLPEATPLTLSETTATSSKWHLLLNKSQTLILAPKTHNFTITIVKTDSTELTLYKGIMNVNNRVYSNYSNNYYIASLLKQRMPTVSDNDYLIGTMWVNVLTDRVYFLTSIVNNEAKWIDYSDQFDKLNMRIDDFGQHISNIDEITIVKNANDELRVAQDILDDIDDKLDKAPIDNIPLINSSGKIDKNYYDAGSFGYEPDLETIILNDEEELKVSNKLKIDGGYL